MVCVRGVRRARGTTDATAVQYRSERLQTLLYGVCAALAKLYLVEDDGELFAASVLQHASELDVCVGAVNEPPGAQLLHSCCCRRCCVACSPWQRPSAP